MTSAYDTEARDMRARMAQLAKGPAHPVEGIERSWRQQELDSKLNMLGNIYGAHVPMRKRMELQIVSQPQRLAGLPSSRLGMEVLLNKHEDIDFDDFLGDPAYAAEAIDVHLAMEKRLGMDRELGKPPRAIRQALDGSLSAHRAAVKDF